jgi:hypothetical protein
MYYPDICLEELRKHTETSVRIAFIRPSFEVCSVTTLFYSYMESKNSRKYKDIIQEINIDSRNNKLQNISTEYSKYIGELCCVLCC